MENTEEKHEERDSLLARMEELEEKIDALVLLSNDALLDFDTRIFALEPEGEGIREKTLRDALVAISNRGKTGQDGNTFLAGMHAAMQAVGELLKTPKFKELRERALFDNTLPPPAAGLLRQAETEDVPNA